MGAKAVSNEVGFYRKAYSLGCSAKDASQPQALHTLMDTKDTRTLFDHERKGISVCLRPRSTVQCFHRTKCNGRGNSLVVSHSAKCRATGDRSD